MKIIRPITVTDGGSFTRASSGTYYDKTGILQTATTDVPRFTYDPATLKPLGLIEESAATNLLLYSEQFDNAAHTKTSASITANSTTAPDGNATADLVTTSAATGGVSQSATVVNGSTYTVSCFVKAGTSTAIRILDTVSGVQADYNLTAKTATITSGTGTATISAVGSSGWLRVSLKFTATSTTATPAIRNNNGSAIATFYVWGEQFELGTRATSYIVTTSATATRAADVNTSGMLSNVAEADYTAWSSTKVYNTGDYVMVIGTPGQTIHKVYQSLVGKSSTITMTIASPAVVTWTAHGLTAGTPVSFTTTGALPTGVTANTAYYVIATGLTTDTFQFSATLGGSAVNTSGSQSGVHTAVASANLNKAPATNPTSWLDVGSTNRWKMFDQSVQSQTSNADAIFVAIKPGARLDSVGLLNISSAELRVVLNDPTDGTVYDRIVATVGTDGITDWYAYFFEPISLKTDFALTDLPAYGTATVNIMIYNTGNTVACGAAIIGFSKDIGDTEFGAKVGIQDYSVKTKDSFGNYTIVQRAYNKRANFTVYVESNAVDFLQNLLATYRSTPVLYIGEDTFGATIVYGFYKNFDIDIGYLDGQSICTLEVEGLT